MIQFFTQRKNGVISIMLSIILIPMLFFGSTLMEAARIHSARALLSEIVDNGVFSLLAMYDEDLLSRFGLLALDPDVSVEEMDQYLMEAANELIEDPTNLEKILKIQKSGIQAEKLFALNDKEVLSRQIMEYMKYRGPVTLGASALDLEGLTEQINELFGSALPFFNEIVASANAIEKILDTVGNVWDYSTKSKEFEGFITSYNDAYRDYESSLSDLISYKQSEPEKPEREGMTAEEYAEEMGIYNGLMADYERELGTYENAFRTAKSAYTKQIGNILSNMSSYMSAHKEVKSSIGSFSGIMTEYAKEEDRISREDTDMSDEYKKAFENVSDTIEQCHNDLQGAWDTMSSGFSDMNEYRYGQYREILQNARSQANSLDASDITKDDDVYNLAGQYYITPFQMLCDADIFATAISQVTHFFEELAETVGLLVKLVKLIAFFAVGPSTFDLKYTTTIEDDFFSNLPGSGEMGSGMEGTESCHQAEDSELVNQELDKTRKVANEIGYNVDDLPASENNDGGSDSLTNQIEGFIGKLQMLLSTCQQLTENMNILEKIGTIITIIQLLADLVESLIKIAGLIIGNLAQMLYQSVLLNTYITETFSDRMNAEKFSQFSTYRAQPETVPEVVNIALDRNIIDILPEWAFGKKDVAFSGAEVEYILYGNAEEDKNQTYVYWEIFFYRALLNAIPVALDSTVQKAMGAATVFAPLVYIIWLIVETYVDMQFLTLMEDTVPIYKTDIYLSLEGIDELLDKIGTFDTMSEKDNIVNGMMNTISEGMETGMKDMAGVSETEKTQTGEQQDKKNEGIEVEEQKDTKTEETGTKDQQDNEDQTGTRTEEQKSKAKEFLAETRKSFVDNIVEWNYSRYLWFMLIIRSNNTKLKRTADLIQMEMSKKRESDGESGHFMLNEAFTYIRADVEAETIPLLPIPTIPGSNDQRLKLEKIYYGGY